MSPHLHIMINSVNKFDFIVSHIFSFTHIFFRLSHSLHYVKIFKQELDSADMTQMSDSTYDKLNKHNFFNNFKHGEL